MTDVQRSDVLMFVKSESHIVAVLPPDYQNEAIASTRSTGGYTFPPITGHASGGGQAAWGESLGGRPIHQTELPADEEMALDRVARALAAKAGRLHVVDVGKQSSLRRYIEDRLHHLTNFPVLVRPDGRRLEGCSSFTDSNLAKFLADA